MDTKGKDYKSYLNQLEETLHLYLVKKAPALPPGLKEFIVKYGPWITLVLIILTLPLVLAVFGLGTVLAPFSFMGGLRVGTGYIVTLVLSALQLVLEAVAIPGLFKRQKKSWNLLYYAVLIGVVENVVRFDVGGLIIGSLLSLYILFQIREYYK